MATITLNVERAKQMILEAAGVDHWIKLSGGKRAAYLKLCREKRNVITHQVDYSHAYAGEGELDGKGGS